MINLTQDISYGYSFSGGDLESVRKSIVFRPALEGLASDISGIEFYIDNPKNDWQTDLWQTWIDEGFSRLLPETVEKAWVYGHCISIPTLSSFYYMGRHYTYPKWITPCDMSKLTYYNGVWRYDFKEYKDEDLFQTIFFTDSGQIFPMGSLFQQTVEYIDFLKFAWASSTANNACGILKITRGDEFVENQQTTNNLEIIKRSWPKKIGMSFDLPKGLDINIISSPSKYLDFRASVEHFTLSILTSIRSQWLMSGTTSPGTYGSVKATREAASQYVEAQADKLVEAINSWVYKTARLNGEAPSITIKHRGVTPGDDLADDLKMIQGVKVLIDMQTELTEEQKKILYERFGLPYQEPDTLTLEAGKTQASDTAVKAWLDNKKSAIQKQVERKLDGGINHVTLAGFKKLARMLDLDSNEIKDLQATWDLFEDQINDIDEIEEFEAVWSNFENEVLKWIETI